MTYTIEKDQKNGKSILKDSNGNIVTDQLPYTLTVPDDIVDAIIDDMTPGNFSSMTNKQFKNLLSTIARQDWEIV